MQEYVYHVFHSCKNWLFCLYQFILAWGSDCWIWDQPIIYLFVLKCLYFVMAPGIRKQIKEWCDDIPNSFLIRWGSGVRIDMGFCQISYSKAWNPVCQPKVVSPCSHWNHHKYTLIGIGITWFEKSECCMLLPSKSCSDGQ